MRRIQSSSELKILKLIIFGWAAKGIAACTPLFLMRILNPEIFGAVQLFRSTLKESAALTSGSNRLSLKRTFFLFKTKPTRRVLVRDIFITTSVIGLCAVVLSMLTALSNLNPDKLPVPVLLLMITGLTIYTFRDLAVTKYFCLLETSKVNQLNVVFATIELCFLVGLGAIGHIWWGFMVYIASSGFYLFVLRKDLLTFYNTRVESSSAWSEKARWGFHKRITYPSVINALFMPIAIVLINWSIYKNFGPKEFADISIYVMLNGVVYAGLSQVNDYIQSKVLLGANFSKILILQTGLAITISLLGLTICPIVFWVAGPNYTIDITLLPILVVLNTLVSVKYAISSKLLALGQQVVSIASNMVWCGAVILSVYHVDSKAARLIAPAFGHALSLFYLLVVLGRRRATTRKETMLIFIVAAIALLSIFTCIELL